MDTIRRGVVAAITPLVILSNALPTAAFETFDPLKNLDADLANAAKDVRNWHVSTEVSPIDITQNAFASVGANQVITASSESETWASLYLRCKEGVTSVFVVFSDQRLSDDEGHGTVDLRIDNGSPFERDMRVSDGGDALGLWSGSEPIRFIRSLLDAETLVVRVDPMEGGPITAIFEISGIEAAVIPVSEACGWSARSIWTQIGYILSPY
jgi:type VI secretion system protein VasI